MSDNYISNFEHTAIYQEKLFCSAMLPRKNEEAFGQLLKLNTMQTRISGKQESTFCFTLCKVKCYIDFVF